MLGLGSILGILLCNLGGLVAGLLGGVSIPVGTGTGGGTSSSVSASASASSVLSVAGHHILASAHLLPHIIH